MPDLVDEPAPAMPLAEPPRTARPDTARSFASAVQALAAGLLIVAAVMKAYGIVVGPQPALPWNRLADFALIEFELLLGGLLLLNLLPMLTWSVALATFTIFAGISVRKAMLGSSSCGCFGPASVSPRIMVAVDAVVVLLLLWSGPRSALAPIPPRARSRAERVARMIGTTTIALLMLLSAAAVTFAAVPKRGLVATQPEYDFGTIQPLSGATCDHTFVVRNTSARPVQITSCHSSCGCTVANYPTDPIAPGASAEIKVHADWSNVVLGDPQAQITLTTDHWLTRTVPLIIRAHLAKDRG